jgi:hypothetical protein
LREKNSLTQLSTLRKVTEKEKGTEQLQPKIANKDYKHSGNKTTTQRSEEYQRWVARYIPSLIREQRARKKEKEMTGETCTRRHLSLN